MSGKISRKTIDIYNEIMQMLILIGRPNYEEMVYLLKAHKVDNDLIMIIDAAIENKDLTFKEIEVALKMPLKSCFLSIGKNKDEINLDYLIPRNVEESDIANYPLDHPNYASYIVRGGGSSGPGGPQQMWAIRFYNMDGVGPILKKHYERIYK